MAIAGLSASHVRRFLKGLEFPAAQPDMLRQAKDNGADQGILEAIGRMPNRTYDSISEVQKTLSEMM